MIGYEEYKNLETLEDIYDSRMLEASFKKSNFVSLEEVAKGLKIEL